MKIISVKQLIMKIPVLKESPRLSEQRSEERIIAKRIYNSSLALRCYNK